MAGSRAYVPEMSDSSAPAAAPTAGTQTVFLNAELRPNRSLSRRGFAWLMGSLVAISFAAGVAFVSIGAWPVFGFFGLDVLLVYLAFRASYRSGRLFEYLKLTREALEVKRIRPSGAAQIWRFHPWWVRVSIDRPPEHESQLVLSAHGKSLTVGAFLSPEERGEVADALEDALRTVRTSPT